MNRHELKRAKWIGNSEATTERRGSAIETRIGDGEAGFGDNAAGFGDGEDGEAGLGDGEARFGDSEHIFVRD